MKLASVALAAAFMVGNLWFGTEDSYLTYLDAQEKAHALEAAGPEALKAAIQMRGGGRGDDPFGLPPLWHMDNGTAVVSVQGSLVNGSAGFFRLFGVIGYDDIKGAIAEALDSKDVKRIVLDIDSGGGAVNGVEDAGNFIRKASTVKPVITFTGGTMASAAYWLGVSADHVFAAKTAQVGSVGTLIVHMERSKQLHDMGVKPTLIRYGKYKALGNPYEPLSDEGKEQLQGLADESGKIFVEYAAERRGVSPDKFQKTMGEGRVFMGRQALEIGLVDAVMSFEEFNSHAKTLDKRKPTVENSRHSAQGPDMKLTALSQAVILAIAGGTAVASLGLSAEAANVEGVKPEPADVEKLTAQATEVAAAFEASKTAAVTAAVTAATTPLTAKVQGLESKVALLEAGASDLTGKATAANELAASYAGVVRASIASMCVALGATDSTSALQGAALLAEHEKLAEQFKAKYPAGGVAAVTPVVPDPKAVSAQAPDVEFLAFTTRR
jgi:signal peptide peptidase SppA